MLDVYSHRGADVGSDHFLVAGKIRLKLKKVHKAYAVDKLKNHHLSRSYHEEFQEQLWCAN